MGDRTLVALDIEATGGGARGVVFAIGAAVSNGDTIKTFRFVRDVFGTRDYASAWQANGYDMPTWTEFWSKHTPILDQLMDGAVPKDDVAFGTEFNNFIESLENEHGKITFVFDTILFDPVLLDMLLLNAGKPGLGYTREGKFVSSRAVHSGSYIQGIDRVAPWDKSETPTRVKSRKVADESAAHNHMPDDDAKYILVRIQSAFGHALAMQG